MSNLWPVDPEKLDDLPHAQLVFLAWLLNAYLEDELPIVDPVAAIESAQTLTEVRRRLAWTPPPTA